MAYCSKCGAEIKGNFCSNCGNPINTLSVQQNFDNNNPKMYSVGDFTYTDEDLKHYENLLNSEISNIEKSLKRGRYINYIGLGILAFCIIHWNITTGFWNAVLTIFCGIYGLIAFISAKAAIEYYGKRLENLKQHNAYTYMMEKIADAKNSEKRMQNIATGLQAANVGLRVFNLLNRL